jgi:hypothetical protein
VDLEALVEELAGFARGRLRSEWHRLLRAPQQAAWHSDFQTLRSAWRCVQPAAGVVSGERVLQHRRHRRRTPRGLCQPADCAYQGNVRQGILETAEYKVAQANARIPRRAATIQVALGALGQGPRPEPEVEVVTLENDQVLKLVPRRGLFTRRPCRGGSEPIPPEALHRYYFRIRIEGQEVRLFPKRDEYGRVQPFAFEPPPLTGAYGQVLFRLQAGKAVVVCYNVPGGGPAWTLTLTAIAAEGSPRIGLPVERAPDSIQ